jgi:hypothetical protein
MMTHGTFVAVVHCRSPRTDQKHLQESMWAFAAETQLSPKKYHAEHEERGNDTEVQSPMRFMS